MIKSGKLLASVGFAAASMFASLYSTANAQDAENFYSGKTVKVIIPYSSGGLYSTFGTLLTSHLQKHIPGKPTVIAQHMPGAGGTTALNYVYNVAPKDGTVVITPAAGIVTTPLLRPGSVRYDPAKFNYLGGWSEAIYTLTVFHTSPVKAFDEIFKKEVIFGSTGTSSLNYQLPYMLNTLFDAKIKVISGYRGGGPIRIAMERGEVHGFAGNYLGWKSTRPEWLRDGKLIHLAQFGSKRAPGLEQVPTLLEFVKTDEQRSVMQFVADTGVAAFTLTAPPEVPTDRLSALEKAYLATLNDPEFRQAATKLGFPISPIDAKEVTAAIKRMTGASEDTLSTVRRVMGYK